MENVKKVKNTGLYIDFPFCVARCAFCAFNIQGYREGWADRYLSALQKELALHAENETLRGRQIGSIYLGGGTPTLYPPQALIELLSLCRRYFDVQTDAEVTVEAHPATIDKDYLKAIREEGINRLSLGVQSFSDEQLIRLGRHHTVNDVYRAFRAARAAGFENIGIDLIYALPDETAAEWKRTLKKAIDLRPEHLSIYGLSIEEGTLFHKRGVVLPSEEEQIAQYQFAQEQLSQEGFCQYEISNFAKPGFASVHNRLYWDRAETLGIGLSAHSYLDHTLKENTDTLLSYLEQIEAGHLPIKQAQTVSGKEEQIDRIIFGLRKREGIHQTVLRHPVNRMETAVHLIDAGFLAQEGDRICLTKRGMLLADEVLLAFL